MENPPLRGGGGRDRSLLGIALDYLAEGRSIVPTCWPWAGRAVGCAAHGARCPTPGKRPLIEWRQFEARRPSPGEVRAWWAEWPRANVALFTGTISALVALDCDSAEGDGPVRADGPLPVTWRAATGQPSHCHLYFAYAGPPLPTHRELLPGVSLRAEGAIVVAPPSRHWTGRRYRWLADRRTTPLAPLPAWLLDRARVAPRPTPAESLLEHLAVDPLAATQSWGIHPTLADALGLPGTSPAALVAILQERLERWQHDGPAPPGERPFEAPP